MATLKTGNILDRIVAAKTGEVAARRTRLPLADVRGQAADASPPRGFATGLARVAADRPAVIAEIKRGSPSLGLIRPDMVAADQARAYAEGGAAALSVLTDAQFFFGGEADFHAARAAMPLPMLRKDFIVDPYQVYESRALGADCILLIMAILTTDTARELAELAHELELDVLAETHDEAEIERTLEGVPFDLIGINNRNLKTFSTSQETTLSLAARIPNREFLVAESGLHSSDAVAALWRRGIRRFLVGEAFVRSPDPASTVRQFSTLPTGD